MTMEMQQFVPTRQYLREILSDFAKSDLYVVFSHDYEDNVLIGMCITGEGLRLYELLNYLREHGIYVLSVNPSPMQDKTVNDEWLLWWELLFMKYSTEN